MTKLEITLALVSFGLLSVTILMAVYSVYILRKLWTLSSNLQDIQHMVASFREHLKMVYSLEMSYGDETLKNLLQHANSTYDILSEYEDIYTFIEIEEEYEDAETEEEEEEVAS